MVLMCTLYFKNPISLALCGWDSQFLVHETDYFLKWILDWCFCEGRDGVWFASVSQPSPGGVVQSRWTEDSKEPACSCRQTVLQREDPGHSCSQQISKLREKEERNKHAVHGFSAPSTVPNAYLCIPHNHQRRRVTDEGSAICRL